MFNNSYPDNGQRTIPFGDRLKMALGYSEVQTVLSNTNFSTFVSQLKTNLNQEIFPTSKVAPQRLLQMEEAEICRRIEIIMKGVKKKKRMREGYKRRAWWRIYKCVVVYIMIGCLFKSPLYFNEPSRSVRHPNNVWHTFNNTSSDIDHLTRLCHHGTCVYHWCDLLACLQIYNFSLHAFKLEISKLHHSCNEDF